MEDVIYLKRLDRTHPLRNAPLGSLDIETCRYRGGSWRPFSKGYWVNRHAFNELGPAWTEGVAFRVRMARSA